MLKCKTWCRFLLSKFTVGCVRVSGQSGPRGISNELMSKFLVCSCCCQRLTRASQLNLDHKNKYVFDFSFPISCFLRFQFISGSREEPSCIYLIKKSPAGVLPSEQGSIPKVKNIALGSNSPSDMFGNLDNCLSRVFFFALSTAL